MALLAKGTIASRPHDYAGRRTDAFINIYAAISCGNQVERADVHSLQDLFALIRMNIVSFDDFLGRYAQVPGVSFEWPLAT